MQYKLAGYLIREDSGLLHFLVNIIRTTPNEERNVCC
ncbi:hypothetical protein T01_3057 [Trichinella spiralis]|uniref:Uncharacterized protein n=1 Tax=Trichinella spiralis TaxID=6334 RepID=A0A0V1AK09_TRISP|nr:hypothetical protein T01_3057 [Trichinella spiralis]